jgi:NAD-dependent SIR2 family protein deacetylase
MSNCKLCGRKRQKGEFDQFFTPEAIGNIPCCAECKAEQIKKARANGEAEIKKHPDWYGPVNQDEPF